MNKILRIIVAGALLIASGCSAGNIGPFIGTSGGSFTLTSSGNPVSTVSITGAGTSSTIEVSEEGYTGTFTATSSNTAVVTVASTTAAAVRRDDSSSGGESFTLTAVSGGTATVTFTDSNGKSASLPVGVTTTTGVIYTRDR